MLLRPKTRKLTPFQLGIAFIAVVLVAGALVMNKNSISATLRSGQTFQIHFPRNYGLQPDLSQVKVNFVPVGEVTGVQREPDNSALVTVKVNNGIPRKLRTRPTAVIRPTTLLGGNYFVDLIPGGPAGAFSGTIPEKQAKLPVEAGTAAQALQPSALSGAQRSVGALNQAMKNDAGSALDRLLGDAPGTLKPAGQVLSGLRGSNPKTDLPNLVSGLQSTSSVLTRQQGQLDTVVSNLQATSSALGSDSGALETTLANLPGTLNTTRTGLASLNVTLGKLRDTASTAGPSVAQLNTTLRHLNPVLVQARPFLTDLNGLLVDLPPLLQELVPVSQQGTTVLDNLRGPVLNRVNGPVKQFLLSPYKGTGPYATSNTTQPMYKEAGGMVSNLDEVSSLMDSNGYAIAIQVGFGLGSAGGFPVNPQVILDHILSQSASTPREGR